MMDLFIDVGVDEGVDIDVYNKTHDQSTKWEVKAQYNIHIKHIYMI